MLAPLLSSAFTSSEFVDRKKALSSAGYCGGNSGQGAGGFEDSGRKMVSLKAEFLVHLEERTAGRLLCPLPPSSPPAEKPGRI